ncbi:MAG: hypothetical protein L3J39_11465 [Verrucomicrobiales bacterium]|nr:hypothetical protein [Verrucomicrobiales bacterium]
MKTSLVPFYVCLAILFSVLAVGFEALGQDKFKEIDFTLRPDSKGTKTVVKLAIKVLDIDEIDGASQTFTANVAVLAAWKDERLAGGRDKRTMPLSSVWNPSLQFSNQQRLLKTFPEVVTVNSDGTVEWIQRYWGKFSQPLDLHDFPLDQHTFTIQLVVASRDFANIEIEVPKDVRFRSGLAKKLSLPDWEITDWQVEVAPVELIEGSNQLPGFAFNFHAKRYIGYYLVKVLLPLLMIVMMSWIVFWIHPSESGSQISVSITSMLTLIAYRFALGAMLPKVSYITRMDGFILFATIMVFIALMEAVTTSRLVKVGKEDLALKMDLSCRVLFPACFIAACIFAIWS